MSPLYYELNDQGEPVAVTDLEAWIAADIWTNPLRRVAFHKIGSVKVSTVFLGLDHNWSDLGPPILWETMIFGGEHDQYQTRCSGSREQALAMHQKALNLVKAKRAVK